MRRVVIGAAIVLCLALLSWGRAARRSPVPGLLIDGRRVDIILVTIDALRADHLGVYGYDRPTSPNLDRLAVDAAVVRNHISQAPFTKASIASLFTGLFPTSHKAFTTSRSFSETMTGHVTGSLPVTDVLDSTLWRLPSALAAAGYETAGVNANPFLLDEFGFAKGFDHYEFVTKGPNLASAEQVIGRALARIDGRDARKPLFLWLHLMEPHSPYMPAPEYRSMFPPRTPPRPAPADAIPPWIAENGSTDANVYEALYDAEIREADTALGRFFDALKSRNLWSSLVLVVTADHGEEFFDHGGFEHNKTLYDEMLRVPLFVRAPGLRGGMREIQTQAVDLAPTLATIAGVPVPDYLAGADVWKDLHQRGGGAPLAYAERSGQLFAIRTREWKFISDLIAHHELYNLAVDPGEIHDLAPTNPDRTREMRNRLTAVVGVAVRTGQRVQGQYAPIPPRVLRRLKSLGYVQ